MGGGFESHLPPGHEKRERKQSSTSREWLSTGAGSGERGERGEAGDHGIRGIGIMDDMDVVETKWITGVDVGYSQVVGWQGVVA
jgi:hypothetical protein